MDVRSMAEDAAIVRELTAGTSLTWTGAGGSR